LTFFYHIYFLILDKHRLITEVVYFFMVNLFKIQMLILFSFELVKVEIGSTPQNMRWKLILAIGRKRVHVNYNTRA
jgi:hypothetical protein